MTTDKDEWFTNPRWDEDEQKVFFTKLKRSKDKKAFYIRAKGSKLLFSGELDKISAAVRLFQFGIEECPTSDLLSSFYLQSARGYVKLNQTDKAIEMFRKTIAIQADKTIFVRITTVWSDYALLVVRENLANMYDEILREIEKASIFLEKEVFLKHALRAIIYQKQNKLDEVKVEKSLAQNSLLVEKSEFTNRPKLGLVEQEEVKDIIELLGKI